jgi:hypothetical protein
VGAAVLGAHPTRKARRRTTKSRLIPEVWCRGLGKGRGLSLLPLGLPPGMATTDRSKEKRANISSPAPTPQPVPRMTPGPGEDPEALALRLFSQSKACSGGGGDSQGTEVWHPCLATFGGPALVGLGHTYQHRFSLAGPCLVTDHAYLSSNTPRPTRGYGEGPMTTFHFPRYLVDLAVGWHYNRIQGGQESEAIGSFRGIGFSIGVGRSSDLVPGLGGHRWATRSSRTCWGTRTCRAHWTPGARGSKG